AGTTLGNRSPLNERQRSPHDSQLCVFSNDGQTYGRIVIFPGGPGLRSGSASRANSHRSDRVLRGSMISSTQNFSAERNGERSLLRRSSISFSLAALSSAASMSAR